MRLIDGDRLEDVIEDECFSYSGDNVFNAGIQNGLLIARDFVQEAPTIDAEPIRHGMWIGKPMICEHSRMRCSVCDNVFLENKEKWKYCPYCGARMDEE